MKIIIDNTEFDYNEGLGLLKLKYTTCPFEEIQEVWTDIIPFNFVDICKLPNIEQRRVGFNCLGTERLIEEVNPVLVDSVTLNKNVEWVLPSGEILKKNIFDVYELYKVSADSLNLSDTFNSAYYYVKFKDTSTNRVYIIWVNFDNVWRTNNENFYNYEASRKISAIDAIAWTITTNIPKGDIEKIVRQGDCILIKKKPNTKLLNYTRHLTSKEYINFLINES